MSEEIKSIKQLMIQGKFKEALQKIETISDMSDLSSKDRLASLLLHCTILSKLGDFEGCLQLAEQALVVSQKMGRFLDTIDSFIIKAGVLWRLGRFDESLEINNQCEQSLSKLAEELPLEVIEREGTLMLQKGAIQARKGDLENALTYFKAGLGRFKEVNNNQKISEAFNNIGVIYYLKGELDHALNNHLQSLAIREEIGNNQEIAASYTNIGLVYERMGDFNWALTYSQKSLALFKEIGNNQEIARALANVGGIYHQKGDLDRALNNYKKSYSYFKDIGNEGEIAWALTNVGNIYTQKGDLDSALEYQKQSLALREQIGNKQWLSRSYNNIGNIYALKGNLTKALEYHQQSLALREEIGNDQETAYSLTNIGEIYLRKGDLIEALKYQQKSLTIREAIGNKQDIAWSYHNIGEVYHLQGELDQALMAYLRGLTIFEEIGNQTDIAMALNNLGLIYDEKGDFNVSFKHLSRALQIFREIGNDLDISETLYHIIRVSINDLPSKAIERYLNELYDINSQQDNRITHQRYLLGKGMLLKSSDRIIQKAQAQKIFQQIIDGDMILYELTLEALLNLCDLLLEELRATKNVEIVSEIKVWGDKLLELAKTQHSYSLLVETYLLQSKLALFELKIEQAKKLLVQAESLAEEKKIIKLSRKVSAERDLFNDQLEIYEQFMDQKPSMTEMLELTRLDKLVNRMLHKKLYDKEIEIFEYAGKMRRLVEAMER
ncbi:MAG: tetratricopeptide repeat protein [Candidatus Hodarchaeota archaeon]